MLGLTRLWAVPWAGEGLPFSNELHSRTLAHSLGINSGGRMTQSL